MAAEVDTVAEVPVAIVGAGPAGLILGQFQFFRRVDTDADLQVIPAHLFAQPAEGDKEPELMKHGRTEFRHEIARIGQGFVDDVFSLFDHLDGMRQRADFGLA